MSFVVATASPPFTATGAIQVYAYEPFSYRFLFPPGNTFGNFSNTSTNLLGYMSVDATGVTFASSNGFNSIVSSNANLLVIVDSQSNVYSNSVFGGAGRFTDASGNSLPSRIVVYANEAFTPIPFYSFYVNLNPATAFTQPTLPVAMNFSGSNSNLFYLGGQPAVTTGPANYVLVGSNVAGQVISANINIQVLSERLQLIGGPVTLPLTVGVPITPVTFTAIPPIASSNLSFTYPAVPSGLGFTDSSGNPVTGFPFRPSDNKIVLAGTPTIATPTFGAQSITVPLRANVTSVFTGNLTASTNLTFNYTETVVFTTPSNNAVFSNAFVNLPITPIPFNAVSYFGGASTIISLSSPDLRSDLSLNSVSGVATLTGTPTFAGSSTFTARAVSLTGVTGSIQFTFTSQNDVLALSPFVDSSLNFIIGRPLSNTLAGYYSSNLTLTATSSAGQPISFSTTGFAEGGIDISSNVTSNGTTITFSGVPTTLVAPRSGTVTANDGILSVTQTVPFAVLNDVFTWSTATPTFLQNQVIAPIQIIATTLSGRVIISYTASGLPNALGMSRTGLITGTLYASTGGTFVVTGSTGISTQVSPPYTYAVGPDAVLLSAPLTSYSLVPGQVVAPINLSAVLSSGLPPVSFALAAPTYGLTITSNGVLGGTLYDGIYPNTLVASADIGVNVSTGTSVVASTITLLSSALVYLGQLQAGNNQIRGVYTPVGGIPGYNVSLVGPLVTGDTQVSVYPPDFNPALGVSTGDIQVNSLGKYVASMSGLDSTGTTVVGSIFYGDVNYPISAKTFLTATQGSTTLYRSAYSVAYSGSGSTWYALGVGVNVTSGSRVSRVYLLKSDDDGETWTLGYSRTTGTGNWALAVQSQYVSTNPFVVYGSEFLSATASTSGNLGAVVLRYSPVADVYMAGGGTTTAPTGGGNSKIYSALRISRMTNPVSGVGEEATIAPSWTTVTSFTNTGGFLATGGFYTETRDYAIDVPAGTPWVAAGSSSPFIATTLRWSSDNGFNWNASTNDFTGKGLAVTYGAGRWIALGSDGVGSVVYAKTSTDGKAWTNITLPIAISTTSTILYSNSSWTIRATTQLSLINTTLDLSGAWIVVSGTTPFPSVNRISSGFDALYPYASNSTLIITSIDPTIQLVSPTSTAYSIMQYTFMTPVTLVINRSPAYFFLTPSSLPNGIRFDPVTGTFSGMPLTAGTYPVSITVKSSAALYNTFDFTFKVYSPYPQKRQDTASAFTSYVRQEAIIAGAQFSRDSNAFPSENTTVGAAMGPFPPLVQQAPEICCKLPS